MLKREKDCVLEVCIKHVTCFKCTICISSTFKVFMMFGSLTGRILPFVIEKKKKTFSRPTEPCLDK